MDNPYHNAGIKPHYLDREIVRSLCFEAHNIVCAGYVLGQNFEASGKEDAPEATSLWKLHYEQAEPRLSQLLLQIAVFVRTFDDIMSSGDNADAYRIHVAATGGEDYIGILEPEGSLTLREACNKIIHATDFRPVYDHVEREGDDHLERKAWHLTGEIELQGIRGQANWEAVIWVENFLEIVLDRVAFGIAQDVGK